MAFDEKAHISTPHLLLPLIEKLMQTRGKIWRKSWKTGKAKQLSFTPGLEQVVRFLKDDDDDSGMSTYSQSECLFKSSKINRFSEYLLKNLQLKIGALRYCLIVLRPALLCKAIPIIHKEMLYVHKMKMSADRIMILFHKWWTQCLSVSSSNVNLVK
jgi:hypothetical protein